MPSTIDARKPTRTQETRLMEGSAAKRAAALASVLAAAGITMLKLVTGVLTGSLGMLSEAAHSGIDLLAAAVTLMTVRVADQPADETHTYGHGKLENLSASIEIVLMAGSAVAVGVAAVRRMIHRQRLELAFSIWPFLVLGLSIAVDWTRSRSLARVAKEHRSEALEADALHFGTDIWSAGAVLAGLVASYAGRRWDVAALEYADPVAALVVAAIITVVTLRLARKTLNSLLDAAPPEMGQAEREALTGEIEALPDVISVDRMRVRRSGSAFFVDLTLSLPRNLSFQRTEQVGFGVTELVQERLPGADVTVHNVPVATRGESVFERLHAVAARSGLAVHDVSVQEVEGALRVEQHLEVPETMPLREAHELATRLEGEMRREVPQITSVLTHIEGEAGTIAQTMELGTVRNIVDGLRTAGEDFPEILDVHDVIVTRGHGGAAATIQVNCHCTLPDELPMSRVHAVITGLEDGFRAHHPEVARVLIHPEPATDNRR